MTTPRCISPLRLFFRMIAGIALTSTGPILMILAFILHINLPSYSLNALLHNGFRVRMIALCFISTGLPMWFFTQLRLARGIRDGEWMEVELEPIRRIVFAHSNYIGGIFIVLAYAIGICMRGRFYWLVGFGQLALPLGAFGDLHKQFVARKIRQCSIDAVLHFPRVSIEPVGSGRTCTLGTQMHLNSPESAKAEI